MVNYTLKHATTTYFASFLIVFHHFYELRCEVTCPMRNRVRIEHYEIAPTKCKESKNNLLYI